MSGAGLSRQHLRISQPATADAAFTITDLGSRAGTFLDGAPVQAGHPESIKLAAELSLGMGECMTLIPRGSTTSAHLEVRERARRFILTRSEVAFHPVDEFPTFSLKFEAPFVHFLGHSLRSLELHGQALAPPSAIQLLRGDRLRLRAEDGDAEVEVLG